MSIAFDDRESLIAELHARIPELSEAQQRVAHYLLHHYAQVPFMTTSELASAAGTSQASVTRFAAALGFGSYAELSRALSQVVLGEVGMPSPAPLERFAREEQGSYSVLQSEVEHLEGLSAVIGSAAFSRCVNRLGRAPQVLLAGFGAAVPPAHQAALYLARLRPAVSLITHLESSNFVQLAHYRPGDYALLFAMPRYNRETFILARLLHGQGVELGLVADRPDLEIAGLASELLVTPVTLSPTTAIPAAALVLASLLLDEVGRRNKRRTLRNLQSFEGLAASGQLLAETSRPEAPYWKSRLETRRAKKKR